jgi:hypothetical protein
MHDQNIQPGNVIGLAAQTVHGRLAASSTLCPAICGICWAPHIDTRLDDPAVRVRGKRTWILVAQQGMPRTARNNTSDDRTPGFTSDAQAEAEGMGAQTPTRRPVSSARYWRLNNLKTAVVVCLGCAAQRTVGQSLVVIKHARISGHLHQSLAFAAGPNEVPRTRAARWVITASAHQPSSAHLQARPNSSSTGSSWLGLSKAAF